MSHKQHLPIHHLVDWLQGQLGEMTMLLERLVRLESPTDDPAAQEPIFGVLREELTTLGFRCHQRRGYACGGLLIAAPQRRVRHHPRQLLIGHTDTVWPRGTLAHMPWRVDQSRAYGPGVFDMKGGLVQLIFALRALAALSVEAGATPLIVVNSDEEIGSPESGPTLAFLARGADRVFVLEPALGDDGRLKTRRKGVGHFVLRVEGRAAHAGLEPERGANAIVELARLIGEIDGLNDRQRGISVNVGLIEGGVRSNVVPPRAAAEIDARVSTQADAERISEALAALRARTPGTSISLSGCFGRSPMEPTAGNQRLWDRAAAAALDLGLDLQQAMAGGASDGNLTSLFAPTLDGLGAVGGGAHASDEFVRLDKMPERCALLALLLSFPPLHG
ncbi:MAG: M20 family metallopeptidase [Myxococcales bacterium]|nr:M20 family metallopeptidase [Myxococcales bacterium]